MAKIPKPSIIRYCPDTLSQTSSTSKCYDPLKSIIRDSLAFIEYHASSTSRYVKDQARVPEISQILHGRGYPGQSLDGAKVVRSRKGNILMRMIRTMTEFKKEDAAAGGCTRGCRESEPWDLSVTFGQDVNHWSDLTNNGFDATAKRPQRFGLVASMWACSDQFRDRRLLVAKDLKVDSWVLHSVVNSLVLHFCSTEYLGLICEV